MSHCEDQEAKASNQLEARQSPDGALRSNQPST